MKFIYQYRTSKNELRDGVVSAPDREAAFSQLKRDGIKPAWLKEAPGFWNKLLGKGKRWIVIIALALVILFLIPFKALEVVDGEIYGSKSSKIQDEANSEISDRYSDSLGNAIPLERKQIWGDEAIVREGVGCGWRNIFTAEADRLFARFVQPGFSIERVLVTPDIEEEMIRLSKERVAIKPDDFEEHKQVKCIVAGMRVEFQEYLRAGGNARSYVQCLVDRQNYEMQLLKREKSALADYAKTNTQDSVRLKWSATNQRLRNMGLPVLDCP